MQATSNVSSCVHHSTLSQKRNQATHSASCAGLTRASMMPRREREPYVRFLLPNVIMDCRVKPGNDGAEPDATRAPYSHFLNTGVLLPRASAMPPFTRTGPPSVWLN